MSERRAYDRISRLLHWTMAALVVPAWIVGYYASTLRLGVGKLSAVDLHKSIATVTLFLIAIRIVWRLTHRVPALSTGSTLMRTVARIGHLALYVLMVALPLSGWAWSSSAGYPIPVAKLFQLPALMAKSDSLKPILASIHVFLAWSMGILVVGHVLAALKHHFMDRDDVLVSMLDGRKALKTDQLIRDVATIKNASESRTQDGEGLHGADHNECLKQIQAEGN